MEPPQLRRHRMQLRFWDPLISKMETLLMRCAALESVIEGTDPLFNAHKLRNALGKKQ